MPLTTVSPGMLDTTAQYYGFKSRIINGAMVIDQRNAGASITPTDGQYSVDRWRCYVSAASKYSAQQNAASVTPPAGFTNYLGVTSLSAYSVTSSDYFFLQQRIEGFNVADLGFGTANAATVTLSFWVRSSLTGTFGGAFQNAAGDRSYPFTYTISSANTWEQKTVSITGDTSGTWLTNNGTGLGIVFSIGMGSTRSATAGSWQAGLFYSATGATSVVGTNGATFYITGVQLERGSNATSFEFRDYGRELILCQRYYYKYSSGSITLCQYRTDTGLKAMTFNLNQSMRSSPTVTINTTAGTGTFSATPYNNDSIEFVVSGGSTTSRSYVTAFDSVAEL